MGIPKIIKIPCHHGVPPKHFFDINLGIGIIKKTTFFVLIFDISPCDFTQISIGRDHWMQN